MSDFPPPNDGDRSADETAPLESQRPGGPTAPPPGYPYSFGQPQPPQPPEPRRPRRIGFAAGVVAAALVVGGAAGVGGAALYHQSNGDVTTDSAGYAVSSGSAPIVNTNPNAPKGSVEQVASAVLPSVVKIEVEGSQEAGTGSGIILSSDGEILTNNHVVEVAGKSGKIRVDFNDGSTAPATIMGTDPLTDTAVIKAQGVSGLKPATIGKSSDLAVGQGVVAIGSPFGLDSTVTSGIVSALNRATDVGETKTTNGASEATVYPAIQTDAAINPGNSGGPLVDLSGRVVGIDASIRTAGSGSSPFGGSSESGSIGLGFAIPIDEVMPVIQQMIHGQTPTHARLGISVPGGSSDSALFQPNGAQVKQVNPGSAAANAGIKTGDVITKVNGQLITDGDSLIATIRGYRPGDQVTVTWTRNGKTQSAQVTLDSDSGTSTS